MGGEDTPKGEVVWPRWKQDEEEEGGGGRAERIPVVADEAEIPVFFDGRRHLDDSISNPPVFSLFVFVAYDCSSNLYPHCPFERVNFIILAPV